MVLFVAVGMAQFACLFLVCRGQDRISQNADWGLEEGRYGENGTEGIQSMVPCRLIENESYLPSQLPWIMFVVCLDGPCSFASFLVPVDCHATTLVTVSHRCSFCPSPAYKINSHTAVFHWFKSTV